MYFNLAGCVEDSITDGPGIRFTVFCQGCPHRCEGCHNPHTWPFETKKEETPEAVFEKIQKNPLTSGVTFSGGEPFCQAAAFAQLGRLCKNAGYEVACYTGYTLETLLKKSSEEPAVKELLQTLDVLVDGPFELAGRSFDLKFCGSKNQRILDVPQSLALGMPVIKRDGRWSAAEEEIPPVKIDYGF